ncbi:MAG: EAL domain-containing protein [Lachnospiraceae bacterium]|nr:EAL domain-containing protein [Lachnospiraceae bacterium]
MTVYEFINQSAFYLATILVSVSCLIYTLAQRHTDRPQNTIFMMAGVSITLSAIFEMVSRYQMTHEVSGETQRIALQISVFMYFLLHAMLPMFFYYYTLFATKNFQRIQTVMHTLSLVPFIVAEILVLINPWVHLVWYIDGSMGYHRNAGIYLYYLLNTFYLVLGLRMLFFEWAAISVKKSRILVYSVTTGLVGILVQLFNTYAKTELFAEAIGFMGLMLALEYDEDRLDTATGVYNRSALLQDTKSYFENGRKFYAICVRIINMELLQRTLGASDNEEIFRMVADYLKSVHPRYMIYRATPTAFVLLNLRGNEGQVRFLSQMISWKMEEGWEFQGRSLPLHGVLLYAGVPDELHSSDDILLMCESPIPNAENGSILVGEDLRAILYRANLETALHRGLSEHNFRVYYQPVYTADGTHMYSAESLIRLNDPEFGELFPGEFIPAAERNGMIEQLGEYTLEEVCRFLESGVPEKLGIRYINVNLSVVQCMNPDFAVRVKRIVDRHAVLPSWINFEITETMAALDYVMLDATIKELKAEGFMFSMEGYGTGFSNLYSIFSLDFDMIKMDKRLLWDAEKSEDGMTILENSVRLVHELSHEVVVVGVETKEQFERARKLAVDWYQGNYFSRPLTRSELEKMI